MAGPLGNSRHERFAQALAKGEPACTAYVSAGYSANDGNAIRLKGNERIAARVDELLSKAAARTEITVAGITDRLIKIADKAEVMDGAPGLSVARAALMDAAKLNGLVVDTVEKVARSPEDRARRLAELRVERDAALTRH
jgi:phage terminase small subunit